MRKHGMALMYIPEEEDDCVGQQLPDTPVFQRMSDKENISSVGSLQILEDSSEEQLLRPRQLLGSLSSNSLASSSCGSLLKQRCNSKTQPSSQKSSSTLSASSDQLQKLRRANYANQKIIMQLSNTIKQLQARLSCYEMTSNELRLQLMEKDGEIEGLKEEVSRLKYERVEEQVILKRQIVGLQGRVLLGGGGGAREESGAAGAGSNGEEGDAGKGEKMAAQEVIAKVSLAESSIEHKQHRFRLKSFRSSLGNLRPDCCCSQASCSHNSNCNSNSSFPQVTPTCPTSTLRSKLQQLQCKVQHLSDQQKLLKFKNKLLQMKIK